MIKVSVFYPNGDGASFDLDYYLDRHIPMVSEALGPACKSLSVDAGVAGGTSGEPAPYVAMTHLLFESVETVQAVLASHAEKIFSDTPNFTNLQPIFQISVVKV